jgi:4-amino-4-deoxy-L-arabinose transferase-like glycosyltransferase
MSVSAIKKLKSIVSTESVKTYLIYLLAVLSPALIITRALRYNGIRWFQALPWWSDEAFYFLQLRGMVEYGAPLGYFGYNGGTASISTFGFHGLGVLVPYFLFAKVFGLHFYTIFLFNVFLMSLAVLVYILLLKPSGKQLVFLLISSLPQYSSVLRKKMNYLLKLQDFC